ncbi:MAG: LTA synthase family protein [Clostridia bacterium]|nr:LTA synthase family protein [Clostridia bacterium]
MKIIYEKYLHHSVVLCALLSIGINIIIESLARGSLLLCFKFMASSPWTFFFNVMIIFTTFSVACLFKHRTFLYLTISIIWLSVGITNGVILGFRTTPFTMTDLSLFDAALKVISSYMSTGMIIFIAVVSILLLAMLVIVFVSASKDRPINYKKNIAAVMSLFMMMAGLSEIAISQKWVSVVFGNLNYAYRDYGVPYCFINTWLNTGISKPALYSKDSILSIYSPNELKGDLVASSTNKIKKDYINRKPNIVMVQLESFFDPTTMNNVTFSQDPIPNFRKLQAAGSSGSLIVPSVGAGTANTEFEILTGMSTRFFGPGEYPYKSILKEKTVETIAYDLVNIGYSTHAIHNHRGDFYGRNEVFANMGFDTFTSVEYMDGITRTPKNYEQDHVLTNEILLALNSTDSTDFVYTISVQGHGGYPKTKTYEDPTIKASGITVESDLYALEYYLQQLYEEDLFVGSLVEAIKAFDENTILVFYGDHLPPLNVSDTDLTTQNVYEEQYVMWSNFRMPTEDKDLYAYQLSAHVLECLGMDEGYLTKYHQHHSEDVLYMEHLKALQYDMLYGEEYIFDGVSPFVPMEMKMGIKDIEVYKTVKQEDEYYVKGANFTNYSKITLHDKVLKTDYISSTLLHLASDIDAHDAGNLNVSQVQKTTILSTSE